MRYFRNNDKSTLRSGAIGERHVRIEISDFVMRTFVFHIIPLLCQLQISVFDPTCLAQADIDQWTNNRWKNDSNQC